MDNGNWAKTPLEKASVLAKHFEKTFTNNNNVDRPVLAEIAPNRSYKIKKTGTKELKRVIKKDVALNKSPGYDGITGKILSELPLVGLMFIRNVFNSIIKKKYFPKVWKVAEIIAIPKPHKNHSIASSYRPISLLPVLSKLFEKILFNRLEPILKQHNLIPNHQFGFRKKHSTIEQVHRVINKISTDIDCKRFCVAVYLDVAKAFDSVWHKGLLHKLKSYLPVEFYELLKSYIADRLFYVKFKQDMSEIMKMQAGVPQGSVLGPVLYLLYTADIPSNLGHNNMIATFADDTVLLASHANYDQATFNAQRLLDRVLKWFNSWNIQTNVDKTVHVIYTNRKYDILHLKINDINIRTEKHAKYLGMVIDEKLLWKAHIIEKRNQAKFKFGQLYWLLGKNSKLSVENKLLIYNSVIAPIWKYGIELWGTASNSNVKIIQRLQSKILRSIVNAPWYVSNEDLHRDLQVNSIKAAIKLNSINHTNRLLSHLNQDMRKIPVNEISLQRRLKRTIPTQLII